MTNEHKNPPQAGAALISDAQLKAALNAYNDFPCPANGSVGRFCDAGQMRAAIVAAIAAGGAQEPVATRAEIEHARDRVLAQSKNSLFRSGAKICAAEILSPTKPCTKPPEGWTCSRTKGHEGPCAASLAAPSVEQDDPTDYEALEREHLGDAEKRTGIYAPSVEQDERGADKDAVTREQIEAWAAEAGINHFTEKHLECLGDFAILARMNRAASTPANVAQGAAIAIRPDQIAEIANKYALGNPRLDALHGFINEVIIVNGAEYAKSE